MTHTANTAQSATRDRVGQHAGTVLLSNTSIDRHHSPPDALAQRTRMIWESGDFGRIAVGFASGAAEFVNRLQLSRDEPTLDVACGTGNLAIPAAKAGAIVTGVDIASNLVAATRAEAERQQLDLRVDEGNAESLPYEDAAFATTMSMFGVMFAPRPERALDELFRVTRPGGRIALASWMPAGFIGSMLRAHVALVPPPAGVPSALEWGNVEVMQARLAPYAARIRSVQMASTMIDFDFPLSPAGVVELFRSAYGPSVRTFAALDEEGRATLHRTMVELWTSRNLGTGSHTRVRTEYLDTRIDLV